MRDMVAFRETTKDWSDASAKNHTYILSPDKRWLYGFVPSGQPASSVKMLKNRVGFDARYRTFTKLKG
jgi:hypothetical protein